MNQSRSHNFYINMINDSNPVPKRLVKPTSMQNPHSDKLSTNSILKIIPELINRYQKLILFIKRYILIHILAHVRLRGKMINFRSKI